jgi:anti-sigma factor RsiW
MILVGGAHPVKCLWNLPVSSDKEKEELVAYLDGELPDEAALRVEKSLVDDAAVRSDVEQLAKSFDLLDLLPSPQASDGFAEKTLTAIRTQASVSRAESADNDSPAEKTPSNYSQRAIAWGIRAAAFVGLLFVATSGFNGAFKQNSEPIDQLLTELPVIQRLDEYQEIRDVEFLKSLNESGLFDERDKAPQD